MKYVLTDLQFQRLSIPLLPEEERALERDLLENGCREPLITWNGTLIDGYKRYRICIEEGIQFETQGMHFVSVEEAISWVCRKRIPHYEKGTPAYRFLVGTLYKAQKIIFRADRKLPEEKRQFQTNPDWTRVSSYIGEELGINHTTVEFYRTYVNALEEISNKMPALGEAILSGAVKSTQREILEYASWDAGKLAELSREKLRPADEDESKIKIRVRRKKAQPEHTEPEIPLTVGVKEMPAYDPDMELRGLTYTIPAWIMAISRVEKKTDQATDKAKAQLARSLEQLKKQIEILLGVMRNG